jgi:hypothetical protein
MIWLVIANVQFFNTAGIVSLRLTLKVLGFEVNALRLLGKFSTTSVLPPVLVCFSYFSDRVLLFAQSWSMSSILCIAGIADGYRHA